MDGDFLGGADLSEMGGFQRTAATVAQQLANQLRAHARRIARLQARRRVLRKELKTVNDDLRTTKKLMDGLAMDRAERAPRGRGRAT